MTELEKASFESVGLVMTADNCDEKSEKVASVKYEARLLLRNDGIRAELRSLS